jgi:ubiquinone/menaquinone biosynthesis C-methylase UbiE
MFTDPVKNLKMLHLREAEVVADLGAGTGFYTLAAGEMVPNGKVYAVEISKDFLEVVKNKVRDAHLKNVHIIWGNIEKLRGTQIGDCIVDAVIVSNVLFQIDDKNDLLEEIKRILKPGGRILLIDWLKEKGFHSKIKGALSKDEARNLFETKGFLFDREIGAELHHYGMILRKP